MREFLQPLKARVNSCEMIFGQSATVASKPGSVRSRARPLTTRWQFHAHNVQIWTYGHKPCDRLSAPSSRPFPAPADIVNGVPNLFSAVSDVATFNT